MSRIDDVWTWLFVSNLWACVDALCAAGLNDVVESHAIDFRELVGMKEEADAVYMNRFSSRKDVDAQRTIIFIMRSINMAELSATLWVWRDVKSTKGCRRTVSFRRWAARPG